VVRLSVLLPTLLRIFGRHARAVPRSLDWILSDARFGHGETNPSTDRSITW